MLAHMPPVTLSRRLGYGPCPQLPSRTAAGSSSLRSSEACPTGLSEGYVPAYLPNSSAASRKARILANGMVSGQPTP